MAGGGTAAPSLQLPMGQGDWGSGASGGEGGRTTLLLLTKYNTITTQWEVVLQACSQWDAMEKNEMDLLDARMAMKATMRTVPLEMVKGFTHKAVKEA